MIKIAWTARSLRDNLEAFELLAQRPKPMIALCMGPFGLPSRVLAGRFGACRALSPAEIKDPVGMISVGIEIDTQHLRGFVE